MSKSMIAVVAVVAVVLLLPPLLKSVGTPSGAGGSTAPAASDAASTAVPAPAVPAVPTPAPPGSAPAIVSSTPVNGAAGVDPRTAEIRVTFNVPMGGGFSWTGGGANFPSGPPGAKPYWLPDRMTCALPVSLKPNWSYRFGLNSPSHKNFRSAEGMPLNPVVFTFTTGAG